MTASSTIGSSSTASVRPIFPSKVSGMAKTFSGSSSAGGGEPAPPGSEPNVVGNKALESIGPGEVVIYGTDRCRKAACWGELMTTAALARGGRGLVTDGLARDVSAVMAMKTVFPVFAAGTIPTSGKERFAIHSFDSPHLVRRHPGEAGRPGILGDMDGVVVIPKEIVGRRYQV